MPAQVKTTHTLIDRKLIVYKRGKSKAWQCRFSLDGKWFKVTTKKRDLEEAKQAATELMYEAKARLKQNLPVAKKSFRHVSALAKKRMQDELRAGTGIASYKSYLKIIDDYLPDYFDKYKITDITQAVIKGYYVHLANEMGKQPAESTIRKHNVTLNRIFDEAVANGYMVPVQVPKLQTKGLKSQKYPEFKLHEVAQIVAGFPSWIKLGSNQARREQRQLLCDYVFVLFDTGARPGKELLNLLWRQVDVKYQYIGKVRKKLDKDGYPKDKSLIETDEYDEPKLDVDIDYTVTLYVDGKTNEREVVAKNKTMLILKQMLIATSKVNQPRWRRKNCIKRIWCFKRHREKRLVVSITCLKIT